MKQTLSQRRAETRVKEGEKKRLMMKNDGTRKVGSGSKKGANRGTNEPSVRRAERVERTEQA